MAVCSDFAGIWQTCRPVSASDGHKDKILKILVAKMRFQKGRVGGCLGWGKYVLFAPDKRLSTGSISPVLVYILFLSCNATRHAPKPRGHMLGVCTGARYQPGVLFLQVMTL